MYLYILDNHHWIENELGDDGAKAVSEMIAKNSSIEELYVQSKCLFFLPVIKLMLFVLCMQQDWRQRGKTLGRCLEIKHYPQRILPGMF